MRSVSRPVRLGHWLSGACAAALLSACATTPPTEPADTSPTETVAAAPVDDFADDVKVNLESWPTIDTDPLDPAIEAQIDEIMAKMTLEQKVGQVIQADSDSVTPEEVKKYRLGSVLSGGNSAPGPLPYASMDEWLEAADAYFLASIDPEGVEIAIPVIWGIDAVHGHANLIGATVFPHNIALGATNNPELIEEIARITARELIVSGHDWTFAPTLATPRDDRWGRTYEGYSESPEIVASYGDRIVYGLQGRPGTEGWLGDGTVISSAKHFLADGGTEAGRDQGDALISETELREIHAQGYYSAIDAEVQTIMASFSSWNGVKITGSKALLTDLLKDRLGFTGFIVGDWNAHGQIPGCTNTDCPQALLAGLDMYMAPDSWKGLYYSTLEHVKSGRIPMERLDDAVRRILRVKLRYGIFDKVKPSERPGAGDMSLLGAPDARAVARQAVRESLVLLKNDGVLPLAPGQKVLVIGDGADSISKASGGWTLSWQGGENTNADFPNGQSILSGIQEVVLPGGGELIFDPTGEAMAEADVVIAVYGEDPYAEFQGDVDHLDFEPQGFDTELLGAYSERGTPVVSVFLSGRPMWMNPEINDSNAFVAAWYPGTEGAGVADVLFRTDPGFDFKGRLPYSWPKTALQTPLNPEDEPYDPLFAQGFGLSYDVEAPALGMLSEDPEIGDLQKTGSADVFLRGEAVEPWTAFIVGASGATQLSGGRGESSGLTVGRIDHRAQEDGLLLSSEGDSGSLSFVATGLQGSWLRESNSEMELYFAARATGDTAVPLDVAIGCNEDGCPPASTFSIAPGDWQTYSLSLSCFRDAGVNFTALRSAASFGLPEGGEIGLAEIRVGADQDGETSCGE